MSIIQIHSKSSAATWEGIQRLAVSSFLSIYLCPPKISKLGAVAHIGNPKTCKITASLDNSEKPYQKILRKQSKELLDIMNTYNQKKL